MARKYNLDIDQGADFTITFDLKDQNGADLDVSGYSAAAALRPWFTYGNTVNFTVSLSTGSLTLELDANTTSNLDAKTYVYTAEISSANTGEARIVEGNAFVSPQVV